MLVKFCATSITMMQHNHRHLRAYKCTLNLWFTLNILQFLLQINRHVGYWHIKFTQSHEGNTWWKAARMMLTPPNVHDPATTQCTDNKGSPHTSKVTSMVRLLRHTNIQTPKNKSFSSFKVKSVRLYSYKPEPLHLTTHLPPETLAGTAGFLNNLSVCLHVMRSCRLMCGADRWRETNGPPLVKKEH